MARYGPKDVRALGAFLQQCLQDAEHADNVELRRQMDQRLMGALRTLELLNLHDGGGLTTLYRLFRQARLALHRQTHALHS